MFRAYSGNRSHDGKVTSLGGELAGDDRGGLFGGHADQECRRRAAS